MSSIVAWAPSKRIAPPIRDGGREKQRDVGRPAPHPGPEGQQLVVDSFPVERRLLDDLIARVDVLAHLVGQRAGVNEIADANAAASDLVLVGWADAARRRANLALAASRFAQHVQLAVIRKNQVGLVADEQPVADVDPESRQLFDLGKERLRVDHHPVADDAHDALVEDARRDEVQDEFLAVHVDRVPGVVSALIASDDRESRGHEIDDLAFPFVTPLRAKNHDVHRAKVYCTSVLRRFVTMAHTMVLHMVRHDGSVAAARRFRPPTVRTVGTNRARRRHEPS